MPLFDATTAKEVFPVQTALTVGAPPLRLGKRLVAAGMFLLVPAACSTQQLGVRSSGESIGDVEFPISCSAAVEEEFEYGVGLLHHMMYVEARKSFQSVAETDPQCAMAHWGVAMTLFQPMWPTRPGPEDLSKGWQEVEQAKALAPQSEREQAYIAAVEAFFRDPESTDYWARIGRFDDEMEQVYTSYPADHEAAAFYALSQLATAPQAQNRLAQHSRAAEILLEIYEAKPNHAGAVHYTIHANDIEARARESLDVVRSYDDIAPSVPHALHMPTHIFVRLGDWEDVISWNQRSADAAPNFPAGDKISHHYLHALDYQVYAYLQRAEDELAAKILNSVSDNASYQETFVSAYHLAAIPARYFVERRQWEDAASLPRPGPDAFPLERFPWPVANTHFARGLGAARSGNDEIAQASITTLATLRDQADKAGEEYFAKQIEVSRLAVEAWLAHAEGRQNRALDLMRSSAELEASMEKHPVTPGAIQPAYELLGDLLLEIEQPRAALDAYVTSLKTWPGRFNSFLGAARAAAAAGDGVQASSFYSSLLELTTDESVERLAIEEAKAYLGSG